MKIEDIHKRLVEKMYCEYENATTAIDILDEQARIIMKHEKIINKVIKDYNFEGRNFKVEYLPVILSMALEEIKKKEEKDIITLAEACMRADIKHF